MKKDTDTQIWSLEKTETEFQKKVSDPVLEKVATLVSMDNKEWNGSPSELAEILNVNLAANALTKYLNVNYGRLLDEYAVGYENRPRHSGRRVNLVYVGTSDT